MSSPATYTDCGVLPAWRSVSFFTTYRCTTKTANRPRRRDTNMAVLLFIPWPRLALGGSSPPAEESNLRPGVRRRPEHSRVERERVPLLVARHPITLGLEALLQHVVADLGHVSEDVEVHERHL